MKKIARLTAISVMTVVGLPVFLLALYIGFTYATHSSDVREILVATEAENLRPPDLVRKYVRVAFDAKQKPSWPVARKLAARFGYSNNVSSVRWQFNWFIWFVIAELTINEADSYALFCALANAGTSNGLNSLAIQRFSKPLSKLDEFEIAELVAYERAPQYFSRNKTALENQKIKLLNSAKNI